MFTGTATYSKPTFFYGANHSEQGVLRKERINYSTFGALMPGRTYNAGDYRYGFGSHEKDDEIKGVGNHLSFGDYGYDPRTGRRWTVDKMAGKMPGWSPYSYGLDNPILYVDPNGELPWPIHIRSFISTSTTGGGLFRGDGRGPSLSTERDITSRVRSSFIVDPAKGTISNPDAKSDFTMFYGGFIPPLGYIPPKIEEGKPTALITDKNFSKGSASFNFHHFGKDPITWQPVTPRLDVHASLKVDEDLENGILTVSGSFTGDVFPSTEAFIVDQTGKNKIFLDARKETGGLLDLYGDNKEHLFNVNMQITFDKDGKFTGVKEGGQTYSVDDWNKKIEGKFEK